MCQFTKHFVFVLAVLSMLEMPVVAQDIFLAIQSGDIEQLKVILEKDQNAINMQDKDRKTALHYAALQGSLRDVYRCHSG